MIWRMSFIAGGAMAGLAVVLGAFGAHGLRARISEAQLQSFETGVRYQLYHALALILVGLISERISGLRPTVYLFTAGTIFFSGSIYLLSTRELLGIEGWKSFLGPITPIGGLMFVAGWIYFCIAVLRNSNL